MIDVTYERNHVVFRAHSNEDYFSLFHYINYMTGVTAVENQRLFLVSLDVLDDVNRAVIPLKGKFKLHDSFKEAVKELNQKVRIEVGVIESRIYGNVPDEAISRATRYFFKPAVRDRRFKEKKWDGYVRLYDKRNKTFPSGLLYLVTEVLDKHHIKYEVQYVYERRPERQFDWYVDDGLTPDPDQVEAIELAAKGMRGVLKAPTGFGKTCLLAKRLVATHGVPTLFVANKKSLLDDAAKEFADGVIGLTDIAEIKEGQFGFTKITKNTTVDEIELGEPHVVVATIQSLHARLNDPRTREQLLYWLQDICKFLIIDETQAVGTRTWDEVLNECYAPLRLCLSATPNRTDGAKLKIHAQSGPLLFSTTAEEQIEKGRLCDLDIKYITYDHHLYNEDDTDIQYHEAYQYWIAENEERNREMIVKPTLEMLEEGRFVLVLIQRIDHGYTLRDMFIREGVNPNDVRFVYGQTADEARQNAIKEFRKGNFKILIGSTIFDAGVNIPVISGVVLAGSGNSEITLIQRIGRGARTVDYEEVLGYLPEFMKQNHNQKVTKVIDIFDINVKYFENQAWNRYKNARDEFGASRVSIVGEAIDRPKGRRARKAQFHFNKQLESHQAQLDLLNDFAKELTPEQAAELAKKGKESLLHGFQGSKSKRGGESSTNLLEGFVGDSKKSSTAEEAQLTLLEAFANKK